MNYTILPFRFEHFNAEEYLLTNDVGEYIFLGNEDFDKFVNYELDPQSDIFKDIASKQIATTDKVEDVVNMLATKFRTKKSILRDFTTLHMVVPTLRCNSSCIYCQVKRHESTDHSADMTKETAKNIVKCIFESPSPCIKIEFQGGDPSTDFEMVKYIIEEAEWVNLFKKRELGFVICTNLTLLTADMVKYLKKHNCYISTSLDGPKEIHDVNRPLQDKTLDHHEIFERNLGMIRSIWQDKECASALMTTSKYSLGNFKSIIDEYVRLGFNNIFLRSLNPYGFAKEHKDKNEIKIFILYLMERIGYPLSLNDVSAILYQENLVSYFDCGDCFTELMDAKHILDSGTRTEAGDIAYVVSPTGIKIATELHDQISPWIKEVSYRSAIRNLSFFKRGAKTDCSKTPIGNGKYSVHCEITEQDRRVLDVTLDVDTELEADKILYNFPRKPEIVFRGMLALLSGDRNDIFE